MAPTSWSGDGPPPPPPPLSSPPPPPPAPAPAPPAPSSPPMHLPVIRLHSAGAMHAGSHSGGGSSQNFPIQPPSHLHEPAGHSPWPLQLGSGHTIGTLHCAPIQPSWQTHMSGRSQSPCPLQQICIEQSAPPQPARQRHAPSIHWPRPEQPLGQKASQAG